MANKLEAWEQQPGESAPAFEAFTIYRDQPPADRAYRTVARELGKSGSLVSGWMGKHQWTSRVAAYDAHMLRIRQDATEEDIRTMSKRHAQLAVGFLNKVVTRLQDIKAEDLSPAQLIQWFEVATKIERQARGIPDLTIGEDLATALGTLNVDMADAEDREQVISMARFLSGKKKSAGGS